MDTSTVEPPDMAKIVDAQLVEQEITKEMGDVLKSIDHLRVIKTDEERSLAVQHGTSLKTKVTNLKALKERVVKPVYNAYVEIRDLFDGRIKAAEAGLNTLRVSVSAYDVEKERLARIERERVEKERRDKEEEHKRQLAAWQLEQDHDAALLEGAERLRLAEEKSRQAERAAALQREEDGRLAQAQAAQSLGMDDRVDGILERRTAIAPEAPKPVAAAVPAPKPAPLPPPPPPPTPVPAVVATRPDPNVVARDVWKYELTDIFQLAKAVVEGRAPVEYLTIARAAVGADVRKLKDDFRCDGIKAWKERETNFKAAAGEEAA